MKKLKLMAVPFKKLWTLIQNNSTVSSAIVSIFCTVAVSITIIASEKNHYSLNTLFYAVVVGGMFGGIILFATLFAFGERKQQEHIRISSKMNIQVMLNEALIKNGSIKKKEEMVRL